MSGGVFICYRREDSGGYAGRIFDRLASRLERRNVFIDVDNIEPGLDFVDVLTERVGSCDALVAVIGKDWLSATGKENRRRLDDPNDFVRIEIEAALKRGVRVIPVLVEDASMPGADDLPDSLKKLARRQGIEISHTRFDSDVERLVETLACLEQDLRPHDAVGSQFAAPQERLKGESAGKTEPKGLPSETEATRRAWRDTILDACRGLNNSKIHVGSDITQEMLADARKYANVPDNEEIVMIDNSLLLKSEILVLGLQGLYWRSHPRGPERLSWSELKHCDIVQQGGRAEIHKPGEKLGWFNLYHMLPLERLGASELTVLLNILKHERLAAESSTGQAG